MFSQIQSGEKLVFASSYNMSGLMTQLAQVTMETETMKTSKNTFLHLSCQASTYSKWDSFFKIRDLYESYVNPMTLKPSLYKRNIFEGGFTKTEKYIFKPDGKTIISTSKRKNRKKRPTKNGWNKMESKSKSQIKQSFFKQISQSYFYGYQQRQFFWISNGNIGFTVINV